MARACLWCRSPLEATLRSDSVTCSQRCRQALFRLRRRRATFAARDRPMRVAYADPPYPGTAARYYRNEPTYAGEVDHVALVERLVREFPDGWALSTSAKSLRWLLPLCPDGARVCPWVKPHTPSPNTEGLHNCWEPLIVVGGRQERPGKRDWLSALPARKEGTLPGRKPQRFCAFLFDCLGMREGDELVDLFPGTGIVSRAWEALSRRPSSGDASATPAADGSVAQGLSDRSVARRRRHASLLQIGDGFEIGQLSPVDG